MKKVLIFLALSLFFPSSCQPQDPNQEIIEKIVKGKLISPSSYRYINSEHYKGVPDDVLASAAFTYAITKIPEIKKVTNDALVYIHENWDSFKTYILVYEAANTYSCLLYNECYAIFENNKLIALNIDNTWTLEYSNIYEQKTSIDFCDFLLNIEDYKHINEIENTYEALKVFREILIKRRDIATQLLSYALLEGCN